jgi:hypothetical protein
MQGCRQDTTSMGVFAKDVTRPACRSGGSDHVHNALFVQFCTHLPASPTARSRSRSFTTLIRTDLPVQRPEPPTPPPPSRGVFDNRPEITPASIAVQRRPQRGFCTVGYHCVEHIPKGQGRLARFEPLSSPIPALGRGAGTESAEPSLHRSSRASRRCCRDRRCDSHESRHPLDRACPAYPRDHRSTRARPN